MARSTGRQFTLEIVADASKAQRTFQGLGRTLGGVAAGVGAVGVLRFLNDSTQAALDAEEAINAVNRATGDAAQGILNLGRDSLERWGLAASSINEAAVGLIGFAEKVNAANPAGAIEELIDRAVDFASVYNTDVDQALSLFRQGLAGETEGLRRYAVDVSAASVSAYAYANGIAETGRKLTEAEKIQARYGLLLEETVRVQGDYAATADSAANRQRRLNEEWKVAQQQLGQELVPVYNDVLGALIAIAPAAEVAAREVGKFTQPLGDATDQAQSFWDRLRGAYGFAIKLFNPALLKPWEDAAEANVKAWGTIETKAYEVRGYIQDQARATENALGYRYDIIAAMRTERDLAANTLALEDDRYAAARRIIAAKREQIELERILGGGTAVRPPTNTPLALTPGAGGGAVPTIALSGIVADPITAGRILTDSLTRYQTLAG